MRKKVVFVLIAVILVIPGYSGTKCGYDSCHKEVPGMLNVHLVPHTHDDVGWLKTPDQYYYGSKSWIQKAGVQYILDTVVQELLLNPNRRFIYVESAFFAKWWKEQNEDIKEKVKMLVDEGRLEFIGGGWSMNDEAATHYQSIIDQFSIGLKFLNDTFGSCGRPRIGWQIDPFGHSREMASIFARMNYDGLFFGRLDHEDKNQRLISKTAEMIWKASPDNLGDSANIFTGALYNLYQAPAGFCFDVLCDDEPINDSPHSPDYNVDERVKVFINHVNTQREFYKSNSIMLTMGGDFTFQSANVNFKNLDKLIRYGNALQDSGSKINFLYSTPSCYLKSLHDAGLTWPTKTDDFFPYSSDPHSYWTGYFSSRPTSKRYEREGNHFLQVCKQLTALSPNNTHIEHLNFMKETMGTMQHHDAITGTEKQHVANDYHRHLSVAFRACGVNIKEALNNLSQRNSDAKKLSFEHCSALNISMCSISETENDFIVTVYNALSFSINSSVRFPVGEGIYRVFDESNSSVEFQLIEISSEIRSLKYRNSSASSELIFQVNSLPPLGYRSFYVHKEPESNESEIVPEVHLIKRSSIVSIGNKFIRANFDENGFLSAIEKDGKSMIICQEFIFYNSTIGDNKRSDNRSSGAYIFRPTNEEAYVFGSQVDMRVVKGPFVEEVHQKVNDWLSQIIRIYENSEHLELEWMVGPIPVDDGFGKEIVSRFNTGIQSDGVFYTDSNGREMIKRKRDYRETWKLKNEEPVPGNYYPVTTRIALQDNNNRLAIITDRAQGGSSLHDGSLELMIHRRLLHDDDFGVGEALNETAYGSGLIARGKHFLVIGESYNAEQKAQEKKVQLMTTLPPILFFSPIEIPVDEWITNYKNTFSGLVQPDFPCVLLTLEPWNKGELLIRFEHTLEKSDDPKEEEDFISFNVKSLLGYFNITGMRETTLDGSQWLGHYQRLEFLPEPEETPAIMNNRSSRSISDDSDDAKYNIELESMQIKTFVLYIENI